MDFNRKKQSLYDRLIKIAIQRDPYMASGGHFFVREYIREEFSQWGEVIRHEFQFRGNTHQNIILNIPSKTNNKLPPILIGAHYDAVPGTPGADDNGSGVAVLLELAETFAKNPLKYPIRLVAFDLEEYGLIGSKAYVNYLQQKKQPLRLMLSLEMLGYCSNIENSQNFPVDFLKYIYPNKGNFIILVGNIKTTFDLINLSRNTAKQNLPFKWLSVPNNGKLVSATRLSDHSPFWDNGYKAIMVTDTSFLRNPHYHKPSDTIETIDFDFLTNVYFSLVSGLQNMSEI